MERVAQGEASPGSTFSGYTSSPRVQQKCRGQEVYKCRAPLGGQLWKSIPSAGDTGEPECMDVREQSPYGLKS